MEKERERETRRPKCSEKKEAEEEKEKESVCTVDDSTNRNDEKWYSLFDFRRRVVGRIPEIFLAAVGEGKLKTERKCCETWHRGGAHTRYRRTTSRGEKRQPSVRCEPDESKGNSRLRERREGKVNCRLRYTSGNDVVDAKRPESSRRDAENVERRNREKKKKYREKNDVRSRKLTLVR